MDPFATHRKEQFRNITDRVDHDTTRGSLSRAPCHLSDLFLPNARTAPLWSGESVIGLSHARTPRADERSEPPLPQHYGLEVCERASGEIRLLVSGEVDLEAAPMLLDSILCAGEAHDAGHRVVLDLQDVTFIDSSGLAALVEAHHKLTARGQQLLLGTRSERVSRILSLTGLDQVISVAPAPAEEPQAS